MRRDRRRSSMLPAVIQACHVGDIGLQVVSTAENYQACQKDHAHHSRCR